MPPNDASGFAASVETSDAEVYTNRQHFRSGASAAPSAIPRVGSSIGESGDSSSRSASISALSAGDAAKPRSAAAHAAKSLDLSAATSFVGSAGAGSSMSYGAELSAPPSTS